jgi:hypothetical protein
VHFVLAKDVSGFRAIAPLVFQPKTCLFLIQKMGEGKSAVVFTSSATLLRGINYNYQMLALRVVLGSNNVIAAASITEP